MAAFAFNPNRKMGQSAESTQSQHESSLISELLDVAEAPVQSEVSDEADMGDMEEATEEVEESEEAENSQESESEEESEEHDAEQEEEEEQAEEAVDESNLTDWMALARRENPDMKFETMADYDKAMSLSIEKRDNELREVKGTIAIIDEVMAQTPELGEILVELQKGTPLPLALLKAGVDAEVLDASLYEEKTQEELIRAKIALEAKRKEAQASREQLEANQRESEKVFTDWKIKHKLKDSQAEKAVQSATSAFSDFLNGKMTERVLDIFLNDVTRESEISAARDNGRIEGKNEKIQIEKKKKAGDGMPSFNSGKVVPRSNPSYSDPFAQALDKILKDA